MSGSPRSGGRRRRPRRRRRSRGTGLSGPAPLAAQHPLTDGHLRSQCPGAAATLLELTTNSGGIPPLRTCFRVLTRTGNDRGQVQAVGGTTPSAIGLQTGRSPVEETKRADAIPASGVGQANTDLGEPLP